MSTSSHVHTWRRAAVAVVMTGIASTSLVAATTVAAQAEPEERVTNFGFNAQSYGSVTKGNPMAQSGKTAASFIPCTRSVPRSRENFVAQAGDGAGVALNIVQTNNFTRYLNGTTSVSSLVEISDGTLAGGTVGFTDLKGRVKASHDSAGFHKKTVSSIGTLTIARVPVPVPADGQQASFPVPGQGTLTVNRQIGSAGSNSAAGAVNVLRFDGNDGTVEKVGRAFARIDGGVEGGIFGGSAWGSDARTGDLATLGRDPVQAMPCPGTSGRVLEQNRAGSNTSVGFIGTQYVAAKGEQRSNDSALGYTRAQVARARFGVLELRNIRAQANVRRASDGQVFSDAQNTGVGTILVGGQEVDTPPAGEPQDVAGVGTYTVRTVDRSRNGIEVTAVTVVLENGTPNDASDDTIVHLANANLKIGRG